MLVAQLVGEFLETVTAIGNVLAAARVGRYHANSGSFRFRVGAVEQARERRDMRGVQADDAGAERLFVLCVSRRDNEQVRAANEEAFHGVRSWCEVVCGVANARMIALSPAIATI